MSRRRQLQHTIDAAVRPHIDKSISKTRISNRKPSAKTVADRWSFFRRLPRILEKLGFGLRDIHNLDRRHIAGLLQYWEGLGHAAGTLQTYISMLRVLLLSIGKERLMDEPERYFIDPSCYRRHMKCDKSKNWEDLGQNATELVAKVGQRDSVVGMQMLLMDAFGLRVQEAWLLRPQFDWKGDVLRIEHGTKGGRIRTIPVINEHQRQLLMSARKMASENGGSMVPRQYKLSTWRSYYYYIMRTFGITRQGHGITSHGLRHGYLQNRYLEHTGMTAPVRPGGERDRYANDRIAPARKELAEEAGHSRPDVVVHYVGFHTDRRVSHGSKPRARPQDKNPPKKNGEESEKEDGE